MPRMAAKEVARSFVLGKEEAWTDTKGDSRLRYDGEDELWSYAMRVGVRCRDGRSIIMRHSEELPSSTTQRHVSKAFQAARAEYVPIASVPFEGLERADLDVGRVRSVDEGRAGARGWVTVEFWSPLVADFLFLTTVPRTGRAGLFCEVDEFPWGTKGDFGWVGGSTWVTRTRPQSIAHLLMAVAPAKVREALEAGLRVERIGRLFNVTCERPSPSDLSDLLGPEVPDDAILDSWSTPLPPKLSLAEGCLECLHSMEDANVWRTWHLGHLPLQWRAPDLEAALLELPEWT